jgi:hypothetical protein
MRCTDSNGHLAHLASGKQQSVIKSMRVRNVTECARFVTERSWTAGATP